MSSSASEDEHPAGMKDYDVKRCNLRAYITRCQGGWNAGTRESTHLLMDGGCLHIPMQDNNELISVLGRNLDYGIKNFVTERRTPIFQMHADLDIYEPPDNEMTRERFELWAGEIQKVMRDFFQPSDDRWTIRDVKRSGRSFDRLSMLVCWAPQKYDAERDGRLWTKTGIHLIWPWIRVNSSQAMLIRSAWIQHFERTLGLRPKHNTWEHVFDLRVYQGNGLRMVGSDKIEKCPVCKGKKARGDFCPGRICDGQSGKYEADRIYRVMDAYNGKKGTHCPKLLEVAQSNGTMEILMTSIRSAHATPSEMHAPPDWFDSMAWHDEIEQHRKIFHPTPAERQRRREALGTMRENVQAAHELGILTAPKIAPTDNRFQLLQNWIKNDSLPLGMRLPDVYRSTRLVDLVHKVGDDDKDYFLARTDSGFCMNVAREHQSSGIYFCLTSKGLYQKCFCRCPDTDGRKNGPCAEYRSSPYQLPNEVRAAFFPGLHAMMRAAHAIVGEQELMWTDSLPLKDRILLQQAARENLDLRIAKCRAAMQAQYETRFKSKCD